MTILTSHIRAKVGVPDDPGEYLFVFLTLVHWETCPYMDGGDCNCQPLPLWESEDERRTVRFK